MIITRKILKIGSNSLGILLPKDFLAQHILRKGDTVKLNIVVEDVLREIAIVKSYRCPSCQHHFDTNDDYVECPSCGCEDVQEIEEYIGSNGK